MGHIITTKDGYSFWNEMDKEQLAIMSNVRWGIIDSDHYPDEPSIGMTVSIISGCSDLRLSPEQSIQVMQQTGVSDVTRLNGKACVVVKDDREYIRFIRIHK